MADTTTMTIRLSHSVHGQLDQLARSTGRSRSFLAAEAIAAYVELNRWQVAGIEAAIAEADAGASSVDQKAIEAWVCSWGSPTELSLPLPD